MPRAEAVLGLAAYVEAAPDDTAAATALRKLAEGIAAMSAGDARVVAVRGDPAVGGVPVDVARLGLADARGARRGIRGPRRRVARSTPPCADSAVVHADPAHRRRAGQRLVPDADRPGADRLRRRLARAVAARRGRRRRDRPGSRSSRPCRRRGSSAPTVRASRCTTRPPASPTTASQPDGIINRNSGAESTIHGLLTMLALDARPELAERATSVAGIVVARTASPPSRPRPPRRRPARS